jgi:hypothetical protein
LSGNIAAFLGNMGFSLLPYACFKTANPNNQAGWYPEKESNKTAENRLAGRLQFLGQYANSLVPQAFNGKESSA